MTDRYISLGDQKRTVRRLVAADLLKYVALVSVAIWMVGTTAQNNRTVSEIRKTQQQNVKVQTSNTETLDLLSSLNDRVVDCFDPGGKCYKTSQTSSAAVVTELNEFQFAVVLCSQELDGGVGEAQLAACVEERLGDS